MTFQLLGYAMKKWAFTAMLITFAVRLGAYTIPYETWMGTYVGERKVGYLSYKIDKVEFDGIQGYRSSSVMSNRLTVLGTDLTQLVTTVVYTDANWTPIKEDFSMSSGGKTTRVRAVFKKSTVECVISAGSGSSTKSVPIPEGATLVGDAVFAFTDTTPRIGKEYRLHYFNPLTLTVDELNVKAERAEKIKLRGKEYDAIVIKNSTALGDVIVWQDAQGEVLKVEAMMGITMVRESEKEAMSGLDSESSEDFAVLTSVKTDKPIPSPRTARSLDIVLTGLDASMMIGDSRQNVRKVKGKPDSARFHIKASDFDPAESVKLPIDDNTLKDYLEGTPYIDCDVSAIKRQSREIVGDERNAYLACAKIREWIYANLKVRADIGITRSASDVLKSKVGVCRDYAILFAALARAAGIPAKTATGLLYTDNAFYYHVWVECFVGKWVPFDATLATDFVDATHIKLVEGDATSMFGMAKVIGSLKAEVKGTK